MSRTPFTAATDDGYTLAGEMSGAGEHTLIALHGGPGGGTDYLLGIHDLASADRRVVTFDQLGTARSDVPPDDYPWSQERAAADVEAVRRAIGTDRVDVLGHSWGGTLALQYALDYPRRVEHLVLCNTASSTASATVAFLRQLIDFLPAEQAAAAITADALGDHADPVFRAATASWLAHYMSDGTGRAVPDMTAEALAPDAGGQGLWGSRLWFADAAVRGWTVSSRLAEIAAPALVVHGGRDASDLDVNRELAMGLASSTWVTLQKSGHDALDGTDRDAFLALIDSFLRNWSRPEEQP